MMMTTAISIMSRVIITIINLSVGAKQAPDREPVVGNNDSGSYASVDKGLEWFSRALLSHSLEPFNAINVRMAYSTAIA